MADTSDTMQQLQQGLSGLGPALGLSPEQSQALGAKLGLMLAPTLASLEDQKRKMEMSYNLIFETALTLGVIDEKGTIIPLGKRVIRARIPGP